MKSYSVIVETNSYAGNFEREMCAFMTGHIGDCEVGLQEQKMYLEKYIPIEDVSHMPDEHGCHRPVVIVCTPNCKNHEAFEIFLGDDETPSKDSIETMKSQALEYADKHQIKIKGFFLKETVENHYYSEI